MKNNMSKAYKKDYHAKLTIHNVSEMDEETFGRLLKWLEEAFEEFQKADRKDYAKRYTKRLMK